MFVSSLLVMALAPAHAEDPKEEEVPVIYRKETFIDIEDPAQVEAGVNKPTIQVVDVRNPPKGPSLVALRKDFNKEMKQAVDSVK